MTERNLPDRRTTGAIAGAFASQATAVEAARAIAEVEAAVVVAQRVPRDLQRVEADLEFACGKTGLAEAAFYDVKNRGTGGTVHLAREIARIFGNFQHGVRELRRDDANKVSEVLAYAWDVQTNTRSERSFVVPHQKMANGARRDLVDLDDIYRNNQNIGARALRECIFAALPRWYVDQAKDWCRRTLEHGEGVPIAQRRDDMAAAYAALGVRLNQLEKRLGKSKGAWTPQDVAQMRILYRSIQQNETTVDDEFPRLTTEDVRRLVDTQAGPNVPPSEPAAVENSGPWPPVRQPGDPS